MVGINLLNYVDRGIIPGATIEFNQFIQDDLNTDQPDLYLGLLQSAFIIGYCIASAYFGNAVHYHPPFYLCAIGLSIWCVSVFMAGSAYYAGSYIYLFCASRNGSLKLVRRGRKVLSLYTPDDCAIFATRR